MTPGLKKSVCQKGRKLSLMKSESSPPDTRPVTHTASLLMSAGRIPEMMGETMTSLMERILSFEDRQSEAETVAPSEAPGARRSREDAIMANSSDRTDTDELDRIPRNSTIFGEPGRDHSHNDTEVVSKFLREAGVAVSEDASTLPALVADLQRELSRDSGAGPSTTAPRGHTETPLGPVHEYAEEN